MGFLSYLISGISLGSIYAIIALGYTMVYGIAKMLNFAHGDVIMVGAYMSFMATAYIGWSPLASVVLAMAVCTLLGIIIERLAYKPLRNATSLAVLITAIGVSYFLQNIALLIWSSNPKSFTSIVSFDSLRLFDGQLIISSMTLVTIAACIVIVCGLTAIVRYSKIGKAMRAVSEDKEAAQLMGIDINQTISVTFAIGSGLAAVAGVLLCSAYPLLMPTVGAMPESKPLPQLFLRTGSIPRHARGILLGVIETWQPIFQPNCPMPSFFGSDHRPACSPHRPAGKISEKV